MKQLTLVLKPFRARAVLQAIAEMNPACCVVREAKGYGRQKGYLNRYHGGAFSMAYLPKVMIVVWVEAEQYETFIERVAKIARTGRIGDGKVFSIPTDWPMIEF